MTVSWHWVARPTESNCTGDVTAAVIVPESTTSACSGLDARWNRARDGSATSD
jgi:hypothetical protein